MSGLIIFDLDGVLIDSKTMHFTALNLALESIDPKYVITRTDHLALYDGLPTAEKLDLLTIQSHPSVTLTLNRPANDQSI